MRKLHEPLTLPKHPELLEEVNNLMIAIKLHHMYPAERTEKAENWNKGMSHYKEPTWEDVIKTLDKSYHAINEQRHDPRKY